MMVLSPQMGLIIVLRDRHYMMLLELSSEFLHRDVVLLVSLGKGVLHGPFLIVCYV
jgi:hypothetical protein